MIRRDATFDDGTPAWLLISQLAHARLSGELCAAWDDDARPLPLPREKFIETIRRHDDGWLPWEQRPEVHDGVPRDFMEMPLDESLAIWRRSIAVAHTIHPAASVIVGSHFRALCEHSVTKHETRHDRPADFLYLAEDFIEEQQSLRAEYLATVAEAEQGREGSVLDRGLRLLQLFDFASLWLCCSVPTQPTTMHGPGSGQGSGAGEGGLESFLFTPIDEQRIRVAPWPFRPASLELSVVGRRVKAAEYSGSESLAAAESTEVELRWSLEPGGVL